jgi:hypothetical protein
MFYSFYKLCTAEIDAEDVELVDGGYWNGKGTFTRPIDEWEVRGDELYNVDLDIYFSVRMVHDIGCTAHIKELSKLDWNKLEHSTKELFELGCVDGQMTGRGVIHFEFEYLPDGHPLCLYLECGPEEPEYLECSLPHEEFKYPEPHRGFVRLPCIPEHEIEYLECGPGRFDIGGDFMRQRYESLPMTEFRGSKFEYDFEHEGEEPWRIAYCS